MEELRLRFAIIDAIDFVEDQSWIRTMDAHLQDIIKLLTQGMYSSTGELIELKACSWTLHERYYMDTPEQLKWTFYHTKHRILKSLFGLLEQKGLAA